MAYAEAHTVSVTTDSSGDSTDYTPVVTGKIISIAYAKTDLIVDGVTTENDSYFGYQLAASVGAHLMIFDNWGLSFKMTAVVAPAINNLFGDTHDSGGTYGALGVRKTF